MSKVLNLIGHKYGKLTVIKKIANIGRRTAWLCQCDCGNTVKATGNNLRCGHVQSCGCQSKDYSNVIKHGLTGIGPYNTWNAMKQRCYNPNHQRFQDWGGRGITICDEWKNDFLAFYKWSMANGYKKGLSIDRINNNGNYEPSNCRWVDVKIQNSNKRTSKGVA